MVTAKLEDAGPTTTITFESFDVYDYKWLAEYFEAVPIGEGVAPVLVFEGAYTEIWTFHFRLKDDDAYPASGQSAADKLKDFKDLLKSGGDNSWLFTITREVEDSIPTSTQTETLTGMVKNLIVRTEGGTNVSSITGTFEFYTGTAE